MTDMEKAEYERVVRLLTEKLQETVGENDRLRALVANLTEGANALSTLQSLYRNGELPESLRAKCAGLALAHEVPKIQSVPPAVDATCEEIIEPLAVVVDRQRARADRMQREARSIKVLTNGQVVLLDGDSGNGTGDSDD